GASSERVQRKTEFLHRSATGGALIPRHLDWAFQAGRLVPVNVPSSVRPTVPPGRYPVWACLAEHAARHRSVAFLTVEFRPGPPTRWEAAGRFFTDSGTGGLMDEACRELPDAP